MNLPKFYTALILLFGLLALCVMCSMPVDARPFNKPECLGLTKTVVEMAKARDEHASLNLVAEAVAHESDISITSPTGYIRTDADKQFMQRLLQFVYSSTATGPELGVRVLLACRLSRKEWSL